MENLKHLLQAYNNSEPHWLGTRIKINAHHENGYLYGGPGYVMNIAMLDKLVNEVCNWFL